MKGRVLVSGGAGFIGSSTVDRLLSLGYEVRILDCLSRRVHVSGQWPSYISNDVEKIVGDVRNVSDWSKALKDIDYVVHLAAWMDLTDELGKFSKVNTYGTSLLYQTVTKQKTKVRKVVVASSQFVYGQGRWQCTEHGVFERLQREEEDLRKGIFEPKCPACHGLLVFVNHTEDYVDPQNPYSISKYTQELIGLRLGKLWSIPTTALRYSIVHGARQSLRSAYSGALRQFVLWLARGERFRVFEDGNQLRDFVSVRDVAEANVFCMTTPETDYEVYNVGGYRSYTVVDLARMVQKEMGIAMEIETTGYWRPGDSRHSVSDISKLGRLGFAPKVTEEESIKDFVDWARQNKFEGANVSGVVESMIRRGLLRK